MRQVRIALEEPIKIDVRDARKPLQVGVGDLLHRASVHQGIFPNRAYAARAP